jgi:hypothetical protein
MKAMTDGVVALTTKFADVPVKPESDAGAVTVAFNDFDAEAPYSLIPVATATPWPLTSANVNDVDVDGKTGTSPFGEFAGVAVHDIVTDLLYDAGFP